MDTSRLLKVIIDVSDEFRGGLLDLLEELVNLYVQARDNPGTDNSTAIKNSLIKIQAHIEGSVFYNYPPSKMTILENIGGDNYVGTGLIENINKLLTETGQTTAGIVTALNKLIGEIRNFNKSITQIQSGFSNLSISPHSIEIGEFEAGILIPRQLVDSKLSSLIKELESWNRIVRGYQEVAGEKEREVVITGISSGSYEFYIPLGIAAASLLAKTIDKVLEWYKNILEIRKLRLEIEKLGVPSEEPEKIKKHEKDILEKHIKEFAEEIINKRMDKDETNRKKELRIQIEMSIWQIARFVDRGGILEVNAAPPEEIIDIPAPQETENQSAEENEKYNNLLSEYQRNKLEAGEIKEIIIKGSSLRLLPERTEPILQIADETSNTDDKEQEKDKKKGLKT